MAGPWTVLIVEDHDMVAAGLAAVLDDDPQLHVVGRVGTVAEACRQVPQVRPDVVLLDFRLPDLRGGDAVRAVLAVAPDTVVLTVTASSESEALQEVVEAGVMGFVRKDASGDELATAVKAVADGGAYFSRTAMARILRSQQAAGERPSLSGREVEVLQELADGSSIPQIASRLHLSHHTVRNHLRSAMGKLGVHTALDAVVHAARARLVDLHLPDDGS